MYDKLFSPVRIGRLEIKNRVAMPAMGVNLAAAGGGVNDDIIAFYEARARGGVGLIISGVCRVMDGVGASEACQLAARDSGDLQGLARLMDTVHKYGARMFIQLHHPGRNYGLSSEQAVSASAVAHPATGAVPRADAAGDRTNQEGVRERRAYRADGRRGRRRAARGARLPDQQLPVAVSQPARRPIRWQL
jgi:2,4-dienoyl-CoA reductase-like NADH-dependent reductase (Old Yellow Enzyme family)